MVEIRNREDKTLIGSGEIVLENKEEIQLNTSKRIYKKKKIIVEYIMLSIMLLCCTYSFSQSISISKKSTSKKVILKIKLKDNYELKFYDNDNLKRKLKFTGTKYFEAIKVTDHRIYYKIDKRRKIMNVYFFDDIKDLQNRRILDYNEEMEHIEINKL